MNFRQFALNNVKRNGGAYVGYFLSCVFVVMMFFLYAILMFHPQLELSIQGTEMRSWMITAEAVLYGFSFLFLFYSMSVFLKERTKEFGMLRILGAKSAQIYHLILLENLIIGMSAIIVGLVCGFATSKLFLMVGADVLDFKGLFFYMPVKAITVTFTVFTALFSMLSIFAVGFIRKNNIIDLLQEKKKPKRELRANPWLALLSISCFILAIGLLRNERLELETTITILLLGCIGTYFFYTELSVWMMQQLRKRKFYLWRGTRLLWISDLSYQLRDNARMFFILTIVAALAFSVMGVLLASERQLMMIYQKTPFSLEMTSGRDEKKGLKESLKIDKILSQQKIEYQKLITHSLWVKKYGMGMEIISQSDFQSLISTLRLKYETVKDDEVIVINSPLYAFSKKEHIDATFKIGNTPLKVKKQYEYQIFSECSRLAVVSDPIYLRMNRLFPKSLHHLTISYYIPAWKNHRVPHDSEIKTSWEIGTMNSDKLYLRGDKVLNYINDVPLYKFTNFIFVFIVFILSLCIVSFLYFRLFTDFYHEREFYRKLSKVGVSIEELKHISTLKMAVMFFFPLIIAAMESLISLSMLKRHIGLLEIVVPSLYGIGVFFCLQLLYFLIFRSRYLKKLNQWMTVMK
ncbi:ABC transporter permease [Marininema halotolerans]|uniref:Putative ABC transport system permease protein n=1 Tax=Marininema halotolerans TaxID=1155944 RepID=A0A1I6SKF8_9BACL|nr:ABC transporter permease [Marininema halotolerans]SFS77426.1 putative ABC transport system permease protein [Marininema halotolerans]